MLTRIVYIALFVLLSITSVTSAATWWDTKEVHRTEDGCIQYSLQLNDYINKYNGDVFSGVVVQKYGKFYPPKFDKITKRLEQAKGIIEENSVVALKGTINGKNISNIPLYIDTSIKYVAHRDKEKCRDYFMHKGEMVEVTNERYVVRDKKGRERTTFRCKCPVVNVVEQRPVLTEENKAVWEMMGDMDSVNNGVDLSYEAFKVDESITTYLEPNMFNGTYIVNGEVRTLNLQTVKNRTKTVRAYPLKSVYENSAIFYIYDSKNGVNSYYVYKEGNTYKVKKDNNYIPPTEEIINYAEVIARTVGIDLNH